MSIRRLESAKRKFRHVLERTLSMSPPNRSADKNGTTTNPTETRKPDRWKPVALDGGYGWFVVLGSFLIHVFADGFVYSFGVIAESLVQEFNASNAEVSVILSLLTGLMLAAGPIASAMSNRYGCRLTTIVGAIIASLGCAISYNATSMSFLTLSVGIIMGFGFGLMYCPAIMIVTMYFERLRSLATGITVCGAGVGTFVFSKVISYLIVNFSWRTVFLIYAGVVLLCVPCGALYRPIEFEPVYDDDDDDSDQKGKNKKPTEQKQPNGKLSPDQANKLKAHLLSPTTDSPNKIRSAISHHDVNADEPTQNSTNLQRVRSFGEHLQNRHKPHPNDHKFISTGYLNITDVFYRRSVNELKNYDEKMRSLTSLPGPAPHKDSHRQSNRELLKELPEEDENEDSAATSASRAIELWRSFKKMTDLTLLTDPIFILFAVSNFFTSIGFNGPPMFAPMNAEIVLGFSKMEASTTVAAYGVANTIGRILFGLFCDRQFPFKYGKDRARNRLWIYNITLMGCGIATTLVFLIEGYYTFVAYCFFFGLTISSYVCLTSVLLVDLMGLERLTNGLGLLFLVQGIATFVGPPIAGQFYDITKRYDWTFAFCGICLFFSGLMLYLIPICFNKKSDMRLEDTENNAQTPMIEKPSLGEKKATA